MKKPNSTSISFFKIATFLAILTGCSSAIAAVAAADSININTDINIQGQDQDGDVKYCVIHVGPHKTSSSTLQAFLFLTAKVQIMKQDHYHYPWTSEEDVMKSHSILAACLNRVHYRLEPKCSRESFRRDTLNYFQSFVESAAKDGAGIILSTEDFAYPGLDIDQLTSYLLPHQYKIHVVVYYRRFYDWLHSYYNQYTKNHSPKITFAQWLTEKEFENRVQGYSVAVYNRFVEAQGIFNVSVVNMHDNPDNFNTYARFACDHLDNAPNLCDIGASHTPQRRNPSVDLDWVMFREMIPLHHPIRLSELNHDERWKQIEVKFYEMKNVPRLCLSPEWKDKLLQTSLESEIALTPESWYNSKEGLENLKSDFEQKINTILCSVDIEKVLTSSEWQEFLTELKEEDIEEAS